MYKLRSRCPRGIVQIGKLTLKALFDLGAKVNIISERSAIKAELTIRDEF